MAPFLSDLKWDAANYILIKSHLRNVKIALVGSYIKGKKGWVTSPQDFYFILIHRVLQVIKNETMRSVSQNCLLTSFRLNPYTLLEIHNLEMLDTHKNVLLTF